ncbi:MAG TPA: DsbA family protein [Candidatus Dormibacteraeota bacterium]|nr:DsbA family protein [Candidatus Dormibacteraeota bacterium]
MAGPGIIELDVFFDFLCPFVYRASVLLENVARSESRRLRVNWRYFSLTQVNSKDDGWTVWAAPAGERVRGRLAFRAAEAARRQDAFEPLRTAMLLARHRDRLDIDDDEVVDRVAAEAGLDLHRFRTDMADPAILERLAADHTEAVTALGVFGTPTFVFANGESAYVRLSSPIEAPEADEVFERLVSVASLEPSILEIKRPRKPSPD